MMEKGFIKIKEYDTSALDEHWACVFCEHFNRSISTCTCERGPMTNQIIDKEDAVWWSCVNYVEEE